MSTSDAVDVQAPATGWVARSREYLVANPIAGLRVGLRSVPTATWALVPFYVVLALSLGLGSGQLDPAWPSLAKALILPPLLVIFPSLIEEFFYRGILLPTSLRTASATKRFAAATGSTALYVAAHPISPLLGLSTSDFFLDPRMLVIVAALGYTCAYAYLRSGSLRAPILIHWVTVVVWNLLFSGVYS